MVVFAHLVAALLVVTSSVSGTPWSKRDDAEEISQLTVESLTTFGFDYVIVGGGTAGLALAVRLSEVASNSILVIEAGVNGLQEPKINIPALKGTAVGSIYDWNFTTVAQPNVNNRVLGQARGKVLGGSSALNLLVWDRASSAEYDAWEKLGNTGWNWSSMLKYMKKSETFTPPTDPQVSVNSAMLGSSGPIQAMVSSWVPESQYKFIPTMNNLGIQTNTASYNGNPIGTMFQLSNVRASNHTRSYSPTAYWVPTSRRNLYVITEARAKKIVFSNTRTITGLLKATGVVVNWGGSTVTVNAKKEVILSAGSMQSPGLLEVSGIGSPSVLQAAGVQTLVNLPGVGENLQDHMRVQCNYELAAPYTSVDILKFNTTYAAEQMALYNAGQLSIYDYSASGYAFVSWPQIMGSNASAMVTLANTAVANSANEIDKEKNKIIFDYLTTKTNSVPQVEIIFSDGYTGSKGYPAGSGKHTFTLLAAIQHLFHRGSVHISSSDITVNPTINPNYLKDEYDLRALTEAAKYLRKIATTAPLNSVIAAEYEPGPAVQTDADWAAYAKNVTATVFHPVGTCAMMPKAKGGVVDTKLKVYGTANVRVVDASVIPIQIAAHIQTAVLGIAEKAADIIKSGN